METHRRPSGNIDLEEVEEDLGRQTSDEEDTDTHEQRPQLSRDVTEQKVDRPGISTKRSRGRPVGTSRSRRGAVDELSAQDFDDSVYYYE